MKHAMVDIAIAHYFARILVIMTTATQVGIQTTPYTTTPGVAPGSIEFAATLLTLAFGVILTLFLPISLNVQPKTLWSSIQEILGRFNQKRDQRRNQRHDRRHIRNLPRDTWLELKEKRLSLINQQFIKNHHETVPLIYYKVYRIIVLIDTFCYAFWVPAVSVPGYIEWNISKAVALRIGPTGTLSKAEQLWLSRQVPHLIFAGINFTIFTAVFLGSWTLLSWPWVWRKLKAQTEDQIQPPSERRAAPPPSNPLSSNASIHES